MNKEEQKSRKEIIKRRLEAGETYRAIADDFGVSRQRIQQIAKRLGVKSRNRSLLLEDRKSLWEKWFSEGFSISEIAEMEGITSNTVRNYCRIRGIEVPKKKLKKYTHGERMCYINGCRCDKCTEANRLEHLKRLKSPTPSHGESGYRNYGCRCDICKAGHSESEREYRKRRKAREGR